MGSSGKTVGIWIGRGAAALALTALFAAKAGALGYAYTGDQAFSDRMIGADTAFETAVLPLDAAWNMLNTAYPSPVDADFSGLQLSFDGFYDYDSTLLSFTLSAPNSDLLANVAVVPEPATTALLGMGIGLIALRSRRHNAVRSTAA